MTASDTTVDIAIVSYPGALTSAVLGLADVFTMANRNVADATPSLRVREVSSDTIPAAGTGRPDIVVLPPNLTGARGDDTPALLDWLAAQHRSGTVMCSACAGAFWLGHCGLLDGRAATTHWALEEEFRAAFPAVTLVSEEILVDENDIVTAGGVMAWIDLGLYVVNRWLGPQIMSATARQLLVDPSGREQRNYRSFRPRLDHGDRTILGVQHWLERQARETATVVEMAERARLSGRTFLRRFKAATGLAPLEYLQNLRIENARGLLERTATPIAEIAWRVGYADVSAFTRIFRSTTGITPGAYRKRFRLPERDDGDRRSQHLDNRP